MTLALRRKGRLYRSIAVMTFKQYLAYNLWFWVQLLGQILMMTVFVFFWRAVYAGRGTVGGLEQQQTITYILLAQMIAPLVQWGQILPMGDLVREGMIAIELTRPVDLQERFYIETLSSLGYSLLQQVLTVGLFARFVFHLQLPSDPAIWAAFGLTLLLGNAILFCFDWMFACLAFYSTEVWGLHVVREGTVMFFSGALVPLVMLPGWLQSVASWMPFSQALYTPVALLSGIIPAAQAPQVWLVQLAWLAALAVGSRVVFRLAVRKVTVQGG